MRQVGQEQGDSGVLAGCHRQEMVHGTASVTSKLLGLDSRPQSPGSGLAQEATRLCSPEQGSAGSVTERNALIAALPTI